METIYIPRASVLMKDVDIFSNLSKFSAVTGFVSTTPPPVCEEHIIKQGSRFGNLLRGLRNSVLKTSRADYNIMKDNEFRDTIYSHETRSELSEHKKALVQLIKKHETALTELREARIQCWKSQAKINEYKLMIETQKSALKYNQNEKKVRTAALKDTERVLDSWLVIHETDHVTFETKFLKEMKYREKIQKISADIKIDIVAKLNHAIRTLMIRNKQKISDEDISKISHKLFSETCRTYKFDLTENIPCQKEWIQKPKFESSILNGTDIEKKIKKNREKILNKNQTDI